MSKVQAELDETKIILVSREAESTCGNQRVEGSAAHRVLLSSAIVSMLQEMVTATPPASSDSRVPHLSSQHPLLGGDQAGNQCDPSVYCWVTILPMSYIPSLQ